MHASPREWMRDHRPDIAVALLLGLFAAMGVVAITVGFSREHWTRNDFWFDSDLNRIAMTMTESDIPPLHTNVHPAFALFFNPLIRAVPVLSAFNRILIVMSLVTGAWVATLYVILRLVGCRRLDSVLFVALAASSAAALYFSTIPETFPVGALSMLLVVLLVAIEGHRRVPAIAYVALGGVAMGVTVTNGLVLAAAQAQRTWKRSVGVLAGAALTVIVLSLAQNVVFPSSQFVLDPGVPAGKFEEGPYVLSPEAGGPAWVVNAALITTQIAPEVSTRPKKGTQEKMMSFQRSAPGSATAWGVVAALAWVVLLGIGIWSLFRASAPFRFRLVVGLSLLGQLAIHLVYGQEIFPYSMHFLPFLVLTTALASLTPLRRVALALAAVVLVTGLVNNLLQLGEAHDLYRVLDSEIRALVPR